MAYRSSPLNPNARRTGTRGPTAVQRVEAAVRDAKTRALAGEEHDSNGQGVARFRWGNATITVRDTDVISNVVRQVKKDLGITDTDA